MNLAWRHGLQVRLHSRHEPEEETERDALLSLPTVDQAEEFVRHRLTGALEFDQGRPVHRLAHRNERLELIVGQKFFHVRLVPQWWSTDTQIISGFDRWRRLRLLFHFGDLRLRAARRCRLRLVFQSVTFEFTDQQLVGFLEIVLFVLVGKFNVDLRASEKAKPTVGLVTGLHQQWHDFTLAIERVLCFGLAIGAVLVVARHADENESRVFDRFSHTLDDRSVHLVAIQPDAVPVAFQTIVDPMAERLLSPAVRNHHVVLRRAFARLVLLHWIVLLLFLLLLEFLLALQFPHDAVRDFRDLLRLRLPQLLNVIDEVTVLLESLLGIAVECQRVGDL